MTIIPLDVMDKSFFEELNYNIKVEEEKSAKRTQLNNIRRNLKQLLEEEERLKKILKI